MGKVLVDDVSQENKENLEPKAETIDIEKIDTTDLKKPAVEKQEIDDFLSAYQKKATIEKPPDFDVGFDEPETEKPKRKRRGKKEPMIVSGEIISGALFLTVIDLILPSAIAAINNTLDSKKKISASELKMKVSQRNELEPIADEVMRELQIKANPAFILVLSMISIYGLNFVNIKYNL